MRRISTTLDPRIQARAETLNFSIKATDLSTIHLIWFYI